MSMRRNEAVEALYWRPVPRTNQAPVASHVNNDEGQIVEAGNLGKMMVVPENLVEGLKTAATAGATFNFISGNYIGNLGNQNVLAPAPAPAAASDHALHAKPDEVVEKLDRIEDAMKNINNLLSAKRPAQQPQSKKNLGGLKSHLNFMYDEQADNSFLTPNIKKGVHFAHNQDDRKPSPKVEMAIEEDDDDDNEEEEDEFHSSDSAASTDSSAKKSDTSESEGKNDVAVSGNKQLAVATPTGKKSFFSSFIPWSTKKAAKTDPEKEDKTSKDEVEDDKTGVGGDTGLENDVAAMQTSEPNGNVVGEALASNKEEEEEDVVVLIFTENEGEKDDDSEGEIKESDDIGEEKEDEEVNLDNDVYDMIDDEGFVPKTVKGFECTKCPKKDPGEYCCANHAEQARVHRVTLAARRAAAGGI